MKQLRVIVASGYPVVCLGLRQLLEATAGIPVVGETDEGAAALHMVEQLAPDLLVLNPPLRGMTGVEVAQRLRTSRSRTRVLAFGHTVDDQAVFDLLDSGVLGYLLMDEEPEAIVAAVRGVARGEGGWLSRRVAERVARRACSAAEKGPGLLTPRQLEVARLITLGLDSRRIAGKLCITERTVKYHVGNIYSQLGISSRTEILLWGMRHGLAEN